MDLQKVILEKEIALTTFEVRNNADLQCELLSLEFKEIGASGDYFGLRELVEDLPDDQSWHCHIQDVEYRQIAPDVIQLVYIALIKRDESDTGTYSRRSSIWRKEGSNWKMWFHQGTKVALSD